MDYIGKLKDGIDTKYVYRCSICNGLIEVKSKYNRNRKLICIKCTSKINAMEREEKETEWSM